MNKFIKRILIILILLCTAVFAEAQFNVQFEAGKGCKLAIEWNYRTDNSMGHAYTDWSLNGDKATMNWAQLIWEQKFWEAPIWMHGEFRTGMTTEVPFGNSYILGAAIGIVRGKYGFMNLEPLYRYENKQHGYQATFVSGFQHKRLLFSNYIDLWAFDKPDEPIMCSENKLFYNLMWKLKVGVNIELGYNYRHDNKWSFFPFCIIRYDF